MTIDFTRTGPSELAADVRAKRVSARELVQHALDRIDALNARFNAFCALDADGALREAAAIDDRIAAGEDVGALAGVPVGIKDMEDARGFVSAYGSLSRAGNPPSDRDSVQTARLRAAGCVVVGKTNAPEFGLRGETDNAAFGITRNPWNPTRTPGGSSGGSSAALASGMVPLATGSDGGGSIRIPSSATGLSGLKPSFGRVAVGDPNPPGWHLLSVRGPMAARARDVAHALDVVAGPHPMDQRSLPAHPGSFAAAVEGAPVPRRAAWSPTLGFATVDAGVAAACEAAVRRLEAAGTEIVTVDTVFTQDPGGPLGTLVQAYIRRTTEPLRGTEWWDRLDPLVVVAAELSRLTAGALDVVAALDALHRHAVELATAMEGVDILLCPTVKGATAVCENPSTVDALLAVFPGATGELPPEAAGLVETLRAREPFNVPLGTVDGRPDLVWHGMTQGFNAAGVPAGTVLAGFHPDGLPVGLQVVGHLHDDAGVLRAMAALEEVLGSDDLRATLDVAVPA